MPLGKKSPGQPMNALMEHDQQKQCGQKDDALRQRKGKLYPANGIDDKVRTECRRCKGSIMRKAMIFACKIPTVKFFFTYFFCSISLQIFSKSLQNSKKLLLFIIKLFSHKCNKKIPSGGIHLWLAPAFGMVYNRVKIQWYERGKNDTLHCAAPCRV